jgi:hypothetical protein
MTLYSNEMTFDTHVWVVSKILNHLAQSNATQGTSLLLRYVTAACLPNTRYRMAHPVLSKPFSDSLKDVPTSSIPQVSKTTTRPATSIKDHNFLSTIRPLLDGADGALTTLAPNLLQQANSAVAGGCFEVYTDATRVEFHNILCELLQQFEESMDVLQSYNSAQQPSNYKRDLYRAMFYGEALHQLARSDAISTHLKAIEHLLADCRLDKMADVTIGKMTGDVDDVEPELNWVQPFTIHEEDQVWPLWKSYLDWLRLVVVPFDAVMVLEDHVAKHQFAEISIKILAAPHPGDKILPWTKLLELQDIPTLPDHPTLDAKLLIEDLAGWAKTDKKSKMPLGHVNNVLKEIPRLLDLDDADDWTPSINNILEELRHLKHCKAPGWEECVKNVVSKLESLKEHPKPQDSKALIHEIHGMMLDLSDGSRLFHAIRKNPLSEGNGSTACCHCEAILASLIYLSHDPMREFKYEKYAKVLNELQVSHLVFTYMLLPMLVK